MSCELTFQFVPNETTSSIRVDKFLATQIPDVSRSQIQEWIRSGLVTLDSTPATNPAEKLKHACTLNVSPLYRNPPALTPEAIPLTVIFEDDDALVINKPAGLVVHPGAGNPDGTLVNALLHYTQSLSQGSAPQRPGIVHRLDKDTTGLLIVSKTDKAHLALTTALQERQITRIYQAIVWGSPLPSQGRIATTLGRDPRNRIKRAVGVPVARGGKKAVTHYQRLSPVGLHASLVSCQLETGRTHQIRVHMESIGHPLVGDPLYRKDAERKQNRLSEPQRQALKNFGRQALHAHSLSFPHPKTAKMIELSVPFPEDMADLIQIMDHKE